MLLRLSALWMVEYRMLFASLQVRVQRSCNNYAQGWRSLSAIYGSVDVLGLVLKAECCFDLLNDSVGSGWLNIKMVL